jgi:general secretion pathway protein G
MTPPNPSADILKRRASRPAHRVGFTLVEILIVVVILGIMATIVIPQFSNASYQARENTLKDDLRYLRIQLQVFKAQHRDVAPGYPGGVTSATPTEQAFIDQMTAFSNDSCGTNTTGTTAYKFGPYLSKVPQNPVNGLSSIKIVAGGSIPAADASTGWIYQPTTQQFLANLTGNDSTGMAYSSY